jgi:hypothetical protein
MGNFHLENHKKWCQNREAIETALHGHARQERTPRLQSTPHSSPCSESWMSVSETRRISGLSDLNTTAVNEQRGASSPEVDWQHHHASVRTRESVEAAIVLAAKVEQMTPSDKTNKDDCIAVPRPMDVLMGREKLAFARVGAEGGFLTLSRPAGPFQPLCSLWLLCSNERHHSRNRCRRLRRCSPTAFPRSLAFVSGARVRLSAGIVPPESLCISVMG